MEETARELINKGHAMIADDLNAVFQKHGLEQKENITLHLWEGGSLTFTPRG